MKTTTEKAEQLKVATAFLTTKGFHINLDQSWQTVTNAQRLIKLGVGLVRLPYSTRTLLAGGFLTLVREFVTNNVKVVLDFHPDMPEALHQIWDVPKINRDTESIFFAAISQEFQPLIALSVCNEARGRKQFNKKTQQWEASKEVTPRIWELLCQAAAEGVWDINPQRVVVVTPPLADIDWLNGPLNTFQFQANGPTIIDIHDYRPNALTSGQITEYPLEKVLTPRSPQEVADLNFAKIDDNNRKLHRQKLCSWASTNYCAPWIGEVACDSKVKGRELFLKASKDVSEEFGVRSAFWAYGDQQFGATENNTTPENSLYWEQAIRP